MTDLQFFQALIALQLVALFGLICWLGILLNELNRTVKRAGEQMHSKLTANHEIFNELTDELREIRAAMKSDGKSS